MNPCRIRPVISAPLLALILAPATGLAAEPVRVSAATQAMRDSERARILDAEAARETARLAALTQRLAERQRVGDAPGAAEAERARQRVLADLDALQRERARSAPIVAARSSAMPKARPSDPSSAWWDVYAHPLPPPVDARPATAAVPSDTPAAAAPAVRIP